MPPPRERRTTPLVVDIDGQQLSTSIDPDSGTHYIDCHRCGDSITLTVTGHLRNFYNHINGTVCKKNLSKDGVHNTGSRSSAFHLQTSSSSSVSPSESPISSVSGIISSFSNLHASSPHGPHPTPVPEILDSRVLRPHASASASHASAASIPSIQIPKLELCPGVEISWAPGSIWSTYPYHQHLIHTIGWTPASFNKTENKIYLRSDKCAGELSEFDLSPCMECRIIPYSSRFEDFMQRAKEAMKHTPWDYLTSEQLQGLAKRLVCNLKKLRTQLFNAERRMNLLGQKISDYKRILMLIASKDIPGLRRLIATALRRGLNAERIVKLIQKAMAGIYAPQGRFSDRDLGPSFCPLGIVSVLGRVLLRLGIRRPRYSSC